MGFWVFCYPPHCNGEQKTGNLKKDKASKTRSAIIQGGIMPEPSRMAKKTGSHWRLQLGRGPRFRVPQEKSKAESSLGASEIQWFSQCSSIRTCVDSQQGWAHYCNEDNGCFWWSFCKIELEAKGTL